LALTATAASEILIADNHTLPACTGTLKLPGCFPWEPFTTTKEFQSDGTSYIYAKFRDASNHESAIAFARPPMMTYIEKSETLGGRPVLLQVVAPPMYDIDQVRVFYRAIGASDYTEHPMEPRGNTFKYWVPAEETTNGIEYYFQAEDSNGDVLTTLPESNPTSQPYVLPVSQILQQPVKASDRNAFELAVGLAFEIPPGALGRDTNLRVSPLNGIPGRDGLITTTVGYSLTMADGTTTFSQPMEIAFNYSPSDVVGVETDHLRAYYRDGDRVKLVGGAVNTATEAVDVALDHFSDFFLAQGSMMSPPPITQTQLGTSVTVEAAVVDYVPVYSATLHYKPGAGAWKALTMEQRGGTYQATIPVSDVITNGISYYIEASDGGTTATFPITNPISTPQMITVTGSYPRGDLDRDCDVDVADIMTVASRWNAASGDPSYDAAYDFDGDGDIDVADIMQVASAWGQTCGGTTMNTTGVTDADGPVLRLVPLHSRVAPGEQVKITVEVEDAENLGAAQLDLRFDPAQFDVQGVIPGPALSSTGNTAEALGPQIDAASGRVTYGGFSFGEHGGPGVGRLMTLSLIARGSGSATVAMDGAQLTDMDGQSLHPSGAKPAHVTIGSTRTRIYLPLILHTSS
jgi:hypothetical protein